PIVQKPPPVRSRTGPQPSGDRGALLDVPELWFLSSAGQEVRFGWWTQPVAATHWLNRSAGDWKSSVFLVRSLSWRATLFSSAWECAARSRPLGKYWRSR